jgi:hypothetical protein
MTITVRHNSRFRNTFRALILIHAYTDTLILYLLTEPRFDHYGSYDSKGTEGYCTMAIADYNDVTKLDPLPLKSRLANDLPPPEFVGSISHLLVFWTHVARFTRDSMVIGRYCQLWSLQDGEDPYDVVLVGLEYPNVSSSTDEYFCRGIIIRRCEGFVEGIGPANKIEMQEWMQGNPQLELIFLA